MSWSDTQVVARVAAGTNPGNAWVTQNGTRSNYIAFTMVPPSLTSISPTALSPGMQVTFTGSGFGATQGSGSVGFNNTAGTVVSWSDTQVVATVAAGTNPGNAWVTQNGTRSNYIAFTIVSPPTISSLSPGSGSVGTSVTITGTSFGATQGTSTISFNGTIATSTSWSDTSITALVPSGATTGNVVVNVSGLATNGIPFTVLTNSGLTTSRYLHSATLLNNGKTLIAGGITCPIAGSCTYLNSAELYDPTTGAFTNTGSMATARSAPSVLLPNGQVLIAGGSSCDSSGNCTSLKSTEIYDPASETFSSAGNMNNARQDHTMTLLNNGQVLIAGGRVCSSSTSCFALNAAEIYDPVAGTFSSTIGALNSARFGAAASILNTGKVLIAGGFDGSNFPASAELYDPSAGTFSTTGALNTPRTSATATLLNNGKVLIADGSTCAQPGCPTNAVELYDPIAGTFSNTAATIVPRFNHTATLLTNGQVLITGGYDSCSSTCTSDSTTELYDPIAGTFTPGQNLSSGRAGQSATLLTNGNVLIAGGINNGLTLSTSDSYQPPSPTPTNLVSISVTPANPSVPVASGQPMAATGTFNDGSTQMLQSVIWSSSTPSVIGVSNAIGSPGIIYAQSAGSATITATAGSVSGSTTINAVTLTSISVTPANPSLSLNVSQQFTATGTYSDASTKNLTTAVTWNSSNTSVVLFTGGVGSVFDGLAVAPGLGAATITATLGTVNGNTAVTVTNPVAPVVPAIATISPASGIAGTQVTLSGSGFGDSQGNGHVWLGSTYGTVVSWSDTEVIATVTTGSVSGTAQIQQAGTWSNSVNFTVVTPSVSSVTPLCGIAGTQVTISGSGFGATQGGGQVILGTVGATVQSWSDSQIVAIVSSGSANGVAEVLQNGVSSNTLNFNINTPQIASITPTSGVGGTAVTISGSGFGTSQGSGTVWLGSTYGSVTSWSDTQIVADVANNSTNGTVRVQQDGTWSNAVLFTVPVSYSTTGVFIHPDQVSLVVGDTRTLQAVDTNGNVLTGLAWGTSDPTVATLSTDDPPVITAVAPGHVTISAGDGSADLTIYPGPGLPAGTALWSNSAISGGFIPAVPSESGVADVFGFDGSGNVEAVTSDGTTAWTANVSTAVNLLPDFLGGLVMQDTTSIKELDGMTGQAHPAYTYSTLPQNSPFGVAPTALGTDGTIFTVDGDALVAINPQTGEPIATVHLEHSTQNISYSGCEEVEFSSGDGPPTIGSLMVAGDGYAYLPYVYTKYSFAMQPNCDSETLRETHFHLLRMGSDGSSSEVGVGDWTSDSTNVPIPGGFATSTTGAVPTIQMGSLMTNADTGTVVTWQQDFPAYCAYDASPLTGPVQSGCVNSTSSYQLATTAGDSVSSNVATSMPGQQQPLQPVLQRQDGTFVGLLNGNNMIAFDASGNLLWSVPNDFPAIATGDNGVIAYSNDSGQANTFDQTGNISGQSAALNAGWPSWTDNTYGVGSGPGMASMSFPTIEVAPTFSAFLGGNASNNGTASILYEAPRSGLRTIASANLTAQPACSTFLDNLTAIAISNGREPLGQNFTKTALIAEIQKTANGTAKDDNVLDGPSSKTKWQQCSEPNCVAMFPVWFTGEARPDNYTVGDDFAANGPGSLHYEEALSQYNGYPIWLRVFSDWSGSWKGLTSQYIHTLSLSKAGQVNPYGLGTLLHEVLHKQSVGGGFTHADMSRALGLGSCDGFSQNGCSSAIGNACFPNY